MEGGMEKDASRRYQSQKFVTSDAALETHPVGHTPPMRAARNPPSFRSVSENPQHRIRVPDVTERPNRQPTSFPGQEPCREHDILAPRAHGVDIAYVDWKWHWTARADVHPCA